MLPTLAQLQSDPSRYRTAYRRALQQLLIATQPGIVFAIVSADALVQVLLGDGWHGAAPIFQWLGLAALQQPIMASANWLFISQGRSREYMWMGGFNAATSTLAFLIGLPWGPVGVAFAYSLSQVLVRMPVVWWMATRRGPVRLGDLTTAAVTGAVVTIAAFLGVVALRGAVTLDAIPGLIASLAASYAAALLALALLPSGRAMLRESVSMLGSLHRQIPSRAGR